MSQQSSWVVQRLYYRSRSLAHTLPFWNNFTSVQLEINREETATANMLRPAGTDQKHVILSTLTYHHEALAQILRAWVKRVISLPLRRTDSFRLLGCGFVLCCCVCVAFSLCGWHRLTFIPCFRGMRALTLASMQHFHHSVRQQRHQIWFSSATGFDCSIWWFENVHTKETVCSVNFMENSKFCADVMFQRREICSWKFCEMLKSGAGIHFSASTAVPQPSQRAPKAQQHFAVTLLPVRKTRPKANSSFILEIMKKSVWKRLEWKLW